MVQNEKDATKTQRHKGKIFKEILRAFVSWWQKG